MKSFNKARVLALAVGMAIGCVGLAASQWQQPELLIFTLVPATGDTNADAELQGPPARSRIAALDLAQGSAEPRVLTGAFQAAFAPAVSYNGKQLLFAAKHTASDDFQLFEMGVSGWRLRQVARLTGDCTDPSYLPDGRIAFSRTLSNGHLPGRLPPVSLFTLARGSGEAKPVRITFGDYQDRGSQILPDGRILFRRCSLASNKPGGLGPALLMTVNPDGTRLQRFLGDAGSHRAVLSGQPAGMTIRSHRPTSSKTFGLYEVDEASGRVGRSILADPDDHAIEPVVATARPVPKVLPSMVDASKHNGWLLGLNVYLSQVPALASRQPGGALTMRVIEAADGRRLGEAAIERDGSFFLEVPADRPMHLQVVAAPDRVLATCTDIWVRPNEYRGCVGCHEDPELAPENRVPLAVRKLPVALGGAGVSPVRHVTGAS